MNKPILKLRKKIIASISDLSKWSQRFLFIFIPIIILQFLILIFRILSLENANATAIQVKFAPLLEYIMMSLFLTVGAAVVLDLIDKKLK